MQPFLEIQQGHDRVAVPLKGAERDRTGDKG